jgi:hypothetical protein
MDHSFAQGFEAASRILDGSKELTVWDPALVNRGHLARTWGRPR